MFRVANQRGWPEIGRTVFKMATAVKSTRKPLHALLLKLREELISSAKGEPDALATSVQSPDTVEFAAKTAEQDVAVAAANLRRRTLKEVENALRRVSKGTYGICEMCSEEIPPNRLKAIPWARFCLTCEEQRTRN
jgi:DnaK suppressor protein